VLDRHQPVAVMHFAALADVPREARLITRTCRLNNETNPFGREQNSGGRGTVMSFAIRYEWTKRDLPANGTHYQKR
jgi:hypothetical protein